jgi:apolipoprotein D and lipocalin family protein
MKLKLLLGIMLILNSACSSDKYLKTVEKKIEIKKFMGSWYVLAGRFTFLEVDVHNALEIYTWNESEERIDIDFTYNKGSFQGTKKSLPQKGWLFNKETNAHWKVSPIWPFKFDYLIIDIDENYLWTAIGVPDQKYLWIMARDWKNPQKIIDEVVNRLNSKGYNTKDLVLVPHSWPSETN